MIIVVGSYDFEPQNRAAFLASKEHRMTKSRGEAGNLEFVFASDPLDPRRVVLLERWENRAALDAHLVAVRAEPPATNAPAPVSQSVTVLEVVDP